MFLVREDQWAVTEPTDTLPTLTVAFSLCSIAAAQFAQHIFRLGEINPSTEIVHCTVHCALYSRAGRASKKCNLRTQLHAYLTTAHPVVHPFDYLRTQND